MEVSKKSHTLPLQSHFEVISKGDESVESEVRVTLATSALSLAVDK